MKKKYYFISLGIIIFIVLGVIWFMRPVIAPLSTQPPIITPVVDEGSNGLPAGYTLDKYEVEKVLENTCQKNNDCQTPFEYLALSHCPYTSICLDNKCTVVCPAYEQGEACGITNCHGLNITCGPDPAQICTAMYALGDKCRQYASCGVVDGICQQIVNHNFIACETCIEDCLAKFENNQIELFNCESQCK